MHKGLGVSQVNGYPGFFPLARVTKGEIPPSAHTPCPFGRIPSWIYFCRFACLGMKGICRGESCNWPGVG